eukprot:4911450-Pyramimonas_sp.AAC.1
MRVRRRSDAPRRAPSHPAAISASRFPRPHDPTAPGSSSSVSLRMRSRCLAALRRPSIPRT